MMGKMLVAVLISAVLLVAPSGWAECVKTEPLFVISRSKNNNIVQYDSCIDGTGGLSETAPVIAYWVLESGKREELNSTERKHAYGIVLERAGRDRAVISLVSLKGREITVEKAGGRYRAAMTIDSKGSFLERVFVRSHELIFGLPIVEYVELFGRTKTGDLPVYERIAKP